MFVSVCVVYITFIFFVMQLDIDYIDQIAPDFYKKDVIVGNNRHLIFYRNFWQRQRRGTLTVPSVSSTLNTHVNTLIHSGNWGIFALHTFSK